MINLKSDLLNLYKAHNTHICTDYITALDQYLLPNLSYTSPLMQGLVKTICQSHLMMAYNFMHNAIDKAKGAVRIELIAQKYADDDLKNKMLKHCREEKYHSQLFSQLIPATGYDFEKKLTEDILDEVAETYDYDDQLVDFIFRLHAAEIRSWTMLRHYLQVLSDPEQNETSLFQETISLILRDEIIHICYTGEVISHYISHTPKLSEKLHKCLEYINRESWQDISNISLYMAENHDAIRIANSKNHAAA